MHQHYQKRKTWKSEWQKSRRQWTLWLKNLHNLALATVPRVPEVYPQPPGQRQRYMPKNTLKNTSKDFRGDWGHQLIGGGREGRIIIMFQNMVIMVNASDQSSQHKLDTLKKTTIN